MTISKDIAMQTAERDNADYVLAQDPDADRFSAAQIRYFRVRSTLCATFNMELATGNGSTLLAINSGPSLQVKLWRHIKLRASR